MNKLLLRRKLGKIGKRQKKIGSSNYEGEYAITVKNELKLNVDEQQDAIKL